MKKAILYIALLIGGILVGFLINGSSDQTIHTDSHKHDNTNDKETIWTCAMHPQIRKSEPGLCPICAMDLIPLENNESNSSEPLEIKMSPTAMQLANVVTGFVENKKATKTLVLNGKIEVDERKVNTLTTHIGGRLEKLLVSYTGEYISKGQVIAYVYSPELVIAQNELLEAYKFRKDQPEIYLASREKIKNWKVTDRQIDEILAKGKIIHNFPILSHLSGVVISKLVNMGDYVMTGGALFEIANLSTVWAMFDVYERDLDWVKTNDEIHFTMTSSPGKEYTGRVSFVDPVLNEVTRVVKARVILDNQNGQYKPGQFIKGTLVHHLLDKSSHIVVPKTAVMWTGKRSVVYVKTNTDKGFGFTLREIILETSLGDSYSVQSGLKLGEEIAIQGTFSIDAAAQLAGKPSMMNIYAGQSEDEITELKMRQSMEKFTFYTLWMTDWNRVLAEYFTLKDFLTQDNLLEAQRIGKHIENQLNHFKSTELTKHELSLWEETQHILQKSIKSFNSQKDILKSREEFKTFSEELIKMVVQINDEQSTFFIHSCPMAVDNKDGDWLSKEKDIMNPYMGSAMLKCGSLKEQIN